MDGHAKIVEFIIQMMQDIDKMINEMKISLNSRVSAVDEDYLKTVSGEAIV